VLGRRDWTSDTQEAGAHFPVNRELPDASQDSGGQNVGTC